MGASSVTGIGPGSCKKITPKELGILSNGPSILVCDLVASTGGNISSPPSPGGVVTFPAPLPGNSDDYVVLLTPIGATSAYISGKTTDDDGNFSGFGVISSGACDVMYLVAKRGIRANIDEAI